MREIIPNLWFDGRAEEAAEVYASLFENGRIGRVTRYGKAGFEIHGQPEGRVMTVELTLADRTFIALNGGPFFKFTPAISFLVACRTKAEVAALWEALNAGGTTMMELGEYPFSELYGWTVDRFGLSWQVMSTAGRETAQKIVPTLMYSGAVCGRAEEAVRAYAAIFGGSAVGDILRYGADEAPDREGTIKHVDFALEGRRYAAMDSARVGDVPFNEAVSLMIECETQAEIDLFWAKLGHGGDPAAQQCGWLKDRFGVSWQVSPKILGEMLHDPDPARVERVTRAFLRMKKFDIAELIRAFA